MYQFEDYFDSDKRKLPYTIPGEELEDYLRMLDMMLESYLSYKGISNPTKLFSRGLVVTESELVSYFDMPPYYRERDICDPLLSIEVNEAFDYIASRVRETRLSGISTFTESGDSLLRIEYLKESFDLSRTELIGILLALIAAIDRRYERIFGFLQDDITKGTPTIGLLHALISRITPRESAAENMPQPLDERMYTYFFVRGEAQESLTSPLILQPLMRKILTSGKDQKEKTGGPFTVYEEDNNIPIFFDESYANLEFILEEENGKQDPDRSRSAVYLGQEDGDAVLHLLYQYCVRHSERLYVLDMRQLLDIGAEKRDAILSELFLRLKIYNGRIAIRWNAETGTEPKQLTELNTAFFLDEFARVCAPKLIFLFGQKEEPGELASRFIPLLKVPDLTVALRTTVWEYFLNTESGIRIAEDVSVPDLADCYELPYGKVRKVIGHAIATAHLKEDALIDRRLLLESLRQMNQVDFSGLATFVNPAYTWEDITITEEQKALIKTACNRYRLRNRVGEVWGLKRKNAYGNGVSILLYGPPGTGKTMAAQVIANELSLPLYRVDISQISSKYIGETEKNLGVIFKAAAKANVILFFDEADALFSKRTSVGDSHDKYANSETAYLLQKVEEYDGMSILSTNYYNNFDDAFVRRITYSVHMESPDKETRYALWTGILPDTAEVDPNIDFHLFADKFELSGSNIKAILFNAAYMAGAEGTSIQAKHIVRSMEYEFNKLGKLVNESEFGEYDIYLLSGGSHKTETQTHVPMPRSRRKRIAKSEDSQ